MSISHESFENSDSREVQTRLRRAALFTFLVFVFELIGGWWANSLALLGDAGHMFMDSMALFLSWFALGISHQPSTSTKTFGYHRFEIFAALINGSAIFLTGLVLIYFGWQRFGSPKEVHSLAVILVAGLGLVTNLIVLSIIQSHAHHSHDLNLKGALLHVIGDSLVSVGVIIGGVLIYFKGWFVIDAILGMLIGLVLLWGSRKIIADSCHILLEGVPREISIDEVKRELTSIPDVRDVHELHVWCICSNIYALSTHALVNDQKVHQVESTLVQIQNMLKNKFNITHSTIQFESNPCGHEGVLCNAKH